MAQEQFDAAVDHFITLIVEIKGTQVNEELLEQKLNDIWKKAIPLVKQDVDREDIIYEAFYKKCLEGKLEIRDFNGLIKVLASSYKVQNEEARLKMRLISDATSFPFVKNLKDSFKNYLDLLQKQIGTKTDDEELLHRFVEIQKANILLNKNVLNKKDIKAIQEHFENCIAHNPPKIEQGAIAKIKNVFSNFHFKDIFNFFKRTVANEKAKTEEDYQAELKNVFKGK